MPVYSYKCREHGKYEALMPMDHCNEGTCPICGAIGDRMYDLCHVYVDFKPGWDVLLNRNINTKRERDNILQEKGLVRYKD
jgi:predicted nucleic acid-binding Zn ribbon protein